MGVCLRDQQDKLSFAVVGQIYLIGKEVPIQFIVLCTKINGC